MIKDSGDRTQFESGAVRDMHTGKGSVTGERKGAFDWQNRAQEFADELNKEEGMKRRYELQAMETDDELEFIRAVRHKKSKRQKLDGNNAVEAKIIKRRREALIKSTRALK